MQLYFVALYCRNTHCVRLDLLSNRALYKQQRLIEAAKSDGFRDRIIVAKSIESQKTIQKLIEQQRKMDKCQNKLRKCLTTANEDKVKGVMDGKTIVLLNNQFKRSVRSTAENRNPLSFHQGNRGIEEILCAFNCARVFLQHLPDIKVRIQAQYRENKRKREQVYQMR